jgi:hypothetical protein
LDGAREVDGAAQGGVDAAGLVAAGGDVEVFRVDGGAFVRLDAVAGGGGGDGRANASKKIAYFPLTNWKYFSYVFIGMN